MTIEQMFLTDPQGRRYRDVIADKRLDFRAVLALLDDPDRQRRMLESEVHHKRPALAGVVVELEAHPDLGQFFATQDGRTTTRARQALGIAVKFAMAKHGWITTGRKGTLGTRRKVVNKATSGAYQNSRESLAQWFTRAEHYQPKQEVDKQWTPEEIKERVNAVCAVHDTGLEPGFIEMQAHSIGRDEW